MGHFGTFFQRICTGLLERSSAKQAGVAKEVLCTSSIYAASIRKITCCVIFHVISVMSERLETQQELETLKAWKSSSDSEKTALSAQVASLEVS